MFSGCVKLVQRIWNFMKTLGRLGFLLSSVKGATAARDMYYGSMQTA